jgi:hypothetical protein
MPYVMQGVLQLAFGMEAGTPGLDSTGNSIGATCFIDFSVYLNVFSGPAWTMLR